MSPSQSDTLRQPGGLWSTEEFTEGLAVPRFYLLSKHSGAQKSTHHPSQRTAKFVVSQSVLNVTERGHLEDYITKTVLLFAYIERRRAHVRLISFVSPHSRTLVAYE